MCRTAGPGQSGSARRRRAAPPHRLQHWNQASRQVGQQQQMQRSNQVGNWQEATAVSLKSHVAAKFTRVPLLLSIVLCCTGVGSAPVQKYSASLIARVARLLISEATAGGAAAAAAAREAARAAGPASSSRGLPRASHSAATCLVPGGQGGVWVGRTLGCTERIDDCQMAATTSQ